MSLSRHVTLYHSPQSRSHGILVLLEELGADYSLHVLNLKKGEQRAPDYLAINPMGKVPAVVHDGAVVTEQVALYMYLADLYPEAGLAPAMGDPLRGPWMRWIAFYGSCMEPAVMDVALKRDPPPASSAGYGDFDSTLKTLTDQLEKGPYILGERFTSADVLWANALAWLTMFKLVPLLPVIEAYITRVNSRPASVKAGEMETKLIAAQQG